MWDKVPEGFDSFLKFAVGMPYLVIIVLVSSREIECISKIPLPAPKSRWGVTAMRTVYAVHLGVALTSGHEFERGGRGYIDPSDIVGGE